MRALATILFHLLNWLRAPILFVLVVVRFFFFLALFAVLVCFVAVPAQHDITLKLLGMVVVGSLLAYAVRYGYDVTLRKLSAARFA